MAQTNFTPISLYYSSTATNVPTAGNLVAGELAINTADGKLFYKDSAGVVQTIATKNATAGTYSSITTNQLTIGTTQLGAGDSSMLKNRIINGAMVIDQRNAGASGTASSGYPVDRWQYQASQASKVTWQQNAGSVTPPVGFKNYLGISSSSSYSVGSSDYFFISQHIEGYNIADLGWGTADAKTVTLSFQVYSSLTGTFGASIRDANGAYSYPFTYTVSAANTWTAVSVTIAGPTSGTFGSTNGTGFQLDIGLGAGSTYSGTAGSWSAGNYVSATGATSVVGTNGATFYITGVQLEVGTQATSFEYRQVGTELSLCQRYYFQQGGGNYTRFGGGIAIGRSSTVAMTAPFFPVGMRTFPTVSSVNLGNTTINGTAASSIAMSSDESSTNYFNGPARLIVNVSGGLSAGTSYEWESNNNTSTRITYSAEL